ncbi:hypothetical protein PCANC_16608 [Puccinia coronata f. sp. avenae]|uniref:Pectinesterase inhibitor domain-containing protein n=2 Tax=Puccinia coronata f. sp. avenae TaxID=200324 RepID=A0A2N5S6H7_9BASI|nr:hypothetical protein PCANC_16608 [Puccinia coronata f. sp. avenae]
MCILGVNILMLLLGTVLSTQALNFQRKLVARSTDDNKQLLRGEVTITQVSVSCTEATESIKASCDTNDTVQLKESVTSVQVSVTQLKTIVESFDGSSATTHKTTVVGIFSSYFTMINTISETPNGKRVCQQQLSQINESFLSISSVYSTMGIDLQKEFQGSPEYNTKAFDQLGLPPPFAENSAAAANAEEESTSDGKETSEKADQDE